MQEKIQNKRTSLTYIDDSGKEMFGYSQVNLDKIHNVLWFLALIFTMFLALVVFVVWKAMQWRIVGKLIAAIGAC